MVEDEPTIAESVAARLRAEGFQVDIATDGPQAVATARRQRPDLVVLDVMLPGFDGLEVCRRLHAERPVAVLMLTARDDETDLLRSRGGRGRLPHRRSRRELAAGCTLLRRVERFRPRVTWHRSGWATWRSTRPALRGAPGRRLTTPAEFDLLVRLARRPLVVFTGNTVSPPAVAVWTPTSRRCAKLGADLIRTVHGAGMLEVPAHTLAHRLRDTLPRPLDPFPRS